MKKLNILLISILFTTLFLNAFGEVKTTALKVEISGKGKQAIVFIGVLPARAMFGMPPGAGT